MIRAVLFDLDGTLTDSSLGIFRCVRHAFARLAAAGGPEVALPEDAGLRWIIGPPLRESFARLAGADEVERLMAFYMERYSPIGAFENHVYAGVAEALDALAAPAMRLFVATSKNEVDARRILEHFGLAERFDSINGARADGSRAGKREMIGDVIAAHGLATREVAMIGDREYDMIGAKAVGVTGIGALWGYGVRDELLAAGADALAETPAEAAEIALRR
ncbi:MAG: HAD hydrolase-like protein [Rhodospirillales bacterium]|nr:HAD hydrolase-like protein [Rhodospirillales bacterium]